MPFPPGVGGSRGAGDASVAAQSYEVITAEKAIDENNVGNRMLRSMGWHEGLVLFPTYIFILFYGATGKYYWHCPPPQVTSLTTPKRAFFLGG